MIQSKDRVAIRIKKEDPYICCPPKNHFRSKDTHTVKVREWKKSVPCKWRQKESGAAILRQNGF